MGWKSDPESKMGVRYWENEEYFEKNQNDKYGIVDKSGKVLVEPVFDKVYINEPDGYAKFELDGKIAVYPLRELYKL